MRTTLNTASNSPPSGSGVRPACLKQRATLSPGGPRGNSAFVLKHKTLFSIYLLVSLCLTF